MQNKKAHNVNKRLKNAQDVLEAYNAATVQYEEVNDEIAIDLIIDLLHFCEHKGCNPQLIFIEALKYFHFEKYEELCRPYKCRQNHSES